MLEVKEAFIAFLDDVDSYGIITYNNKIKLKPNLQ